MGHLVGLESCCVQSLPSVTLAQHIEVEQGYLPKRVPRAKGASGIEPHCSRAIGLSILIQIVCAHDFVYVHIKNPSYQSR